MSPKNIPKLPFRSIQELLLWMCHPFGNFSLDDIVKHLSPWLMILQSDNKLIRITSGVRCKSPNYNFFIHGWSVQTVAGWKATTDRIWPMHEPLYEPPSHHSLCFRLKGSPFYKWLNHVKHQYFFSPGYLAIRQKLPWKGIFCTDEWMICLWYPVTSYVSNPSKPATFITNLWNELPADMSQREFPYQTSSMNLTVPGCVSCLRVLPCRTFATAATECPLGLGWRLQEHFNYESWPKWMAFTFTIFYYNVITLLLSRPATWKNHSQNTFSKWWTKLQHPMP